ncbi:MAG: LysR family transcriptional regulator [Sphingomonas sp.]|uniref:LysR family transcriptional regulator n=1 Tax=Sphingomonas sp. TaxID=28214 RepID=UPI001ACA3BEB|nr:LysR family transcriptional regulator [Sphingomonas sp.]MBN8816339.1 LysR family transcriptional regulator [Sphingomonas sp.]
MPNLRAIRYFLAVAETGGFSRAAEKLRVAQPSITTQIQLLEHELGVPLLIRHRRGAVLTEAGLYFREQSLGILRQIDALGSDTRAHANEPSGSLVVGTTPSLRTFAVVPVVRRFCGDHPAVRIRMVEATTLVLRDLVSNNQVDAAVVPTIEVLDGLDTIPLATDPLCLVGPIEASLCMDEPRQIVDLKGLPLLIASQPNSFRKLLDRLAARAGIDLNIRIEADALPLSIDLVGAGGCYTVATLGAASEALDRGLVSAAPIQGVAITWVVATARERSRSAATLRFIEMLQQQCAEIFAARAGAHPS